MGDASAEGEATLSQSPSPVESMPNVCGMFSERFGRVNRGRRLRPGSTVKR